jgi:hypothetical protein
MNKKGRVGGQHDEHPDPPAPARDLHKRAGAIPKVKWLDPDNLETA